MSKKDYIAAIGGILAGEWACGTPQHKAAIFRIALSIADVFKQDNVNFDRSKFYEFVFGTPNVDHARKECDFR